MLIISLEGVFALRNLGVQTFKVNNKKRSGRRRGRKSRNRGSGRGARRGSGGLGRGWTHGDRGDHGDLR